MRHFRPYLQVPLLLRRRLHSDASPHPVSTPTTPEVHRVPSRPNLELHITATTDLPAEAPTILTLTEPPPDVLPPSVIIKPHYPRDTQFPVLLHDLLAAVTTTRSLYPDSLTGIYAAHHLAAIALSVALTAGPGLIAAVVAHEPCVDLFLDGDPSTTAYSRTMRRWDTKKPGVREALFRSNPAGWMDPFASPLFWFMSPGFALRADSDDYGYGAGSGTYKRLVPEPRTLRRFPPEGFVPGVGWLVDTMPSRSWFWDQGWGRVRGPTASAPVTERTRMLVSLGDSAMQPEMVDARARFCHFSGAAVGKPGDMGRWLEAVLSDSDGGRRFETKVKDAWAKDKAVFKEEEGEAQPRPLTSKDFEVDLAELEKEVIEQMPARLAGEGDGLIPTIKTPATAGAQEAVSAFGSMQPAAEAEAAAADGGGEGRGEEPVTGTGKRVKSNPLAAMGKRKVAAPPVPKPPTLEEGSWGGGFKRPSQSAPSNPKPPTLEGGFMGRRF